MYNPDTDLIFPPRALPALGDLRGALWHELVTSILGAGQESPEMTAFILMMARINNCATCNSDSYRAMNGCPACSKQSLKRAHETDEALVEKYHSSRKEVEQYLQKKNSLLR